MLCPSHNISSSSPGLFNHTNVSVIWYNKILSHKWKPKKTRVDAHSPESVMSDSYYCQMNRQCAFRQTNGDLTKLIPTVLLPCQSSYFLLICKIKTYFNCQESIIIHGVSTYKRVYTKEKANFHFKSVCIWCSIILCYNNTYIMLYESVHSWE